MSEFLNWAGQHPWLFTLLVLVCAQIIGGCITIVNRIIRHFNIRAKGWPPPHLDADGDWQEEEQEEAKST